MVSVLCLAAVQNSPKYAAAPSTPATAQVSAETSFKSMPSPRMAEAKAEPISSSGLSVKKWYCSPLSASGA